MKAFTKKNESFTCAVCGRFVTEHPTSCRNHCPYCIHSLHVDILPGDRASSCNDVMEPQSALYKHNKTIVLFKCCDCGAKKTNIAAPDDSQEELIKLVTIPWQQ